MCHDHGHFFAGCCVDNIHIFEWAHKSLGNMNDMHGASGVLVLLRVRKLLLVIVAPSIHMTIFCNSQIVFKSSHYLLDFRLSFELFVKWHFNLHRLTMSSFEERSEACSSFPTGATLAEGVITHGVHLSVFGDHDDVINTCRYLRDKWYVLDQSWNLIHYKFTSWTSFCTEHDVVTGGEVLHYLINIKLSSM